MAACAVRVAFSAQNLARVLAKEDPLALPNSAGFGRQGPSDASSCSSLSCSRAFNAPSRSRCRIVASSQSGEKGDSAEVTVSGVDGDVGILPSGEWAHNFSMLNYEDLHAHYESKALKTESGVEDEEVEEFSDDDGIVVKTERTHGVLSGEWPENFSLLNYEDLSAHFEPQVFRQDSPPNMLLADIMVKQVRSAFPGNTMSEIDQHFSEVTGVPVVDENLVVLGVVSKKDRDNLQSLDVKVSEVMSSPAVVIHVGKNVNDAAVLMLKYKIHRLPVVNDANQLVGIVTRTNIFTALEATQ